MDEQSPLQVLPAESEPLRYAVAPPSELLLFRFLGWLFILTASFQLLPLFNAVWSLRSTKLPDWVVILWLRASNGGSWYDRWEYGWERMLKQLMPLVLMAGAVGMLRRNYLARPWLITYSVAWTAIESVTWYERLRAPWWIISNSSDIGRLIELLNAEWSKTLPAVIILYLMSRPHVRSLYERS